MSDRFRSIDPFFALAKSHVDDEPDAVHGPECPVCGKIITYPVFAVLATTESTRPAANKDGKLVEVPTALHKLLGPFAPPKKPFPPSEHLKIGIWMTSIGFALIILGILLPPPLSMYIILGIVLTLFGIILIIRYNFYKNRYPQLLNEWEKKDQIARRIYYCPFGPHVFDPTTDEVLLS